MRAVTAHGPGLATLLRLGRIANLPTVWTNVIAAAVIADDAWHPAEITLIALAMSAFYVGGMYLNDFFDRDIDARERPERPERPIVAGEIGAGVVSLIGFGLLAAGVAIMNLFGPAAMLWGTVLAGVIVLYDLWHKGNPASPLVMGLCRALVYLATGAAIDGVSAGLAVGAVALAAHVIALTSVARQDSLDRPEILWPLGLVAVPLLIALPSMADDATVIIAFALLLAADASAVRLLATRPVPGSVPRAVSVLIAAICLVDALAVAVAGGDPWLVLACVAGYPLTRLFQLSMPRT
jgi:4-hydroxybenzoate polyprenyltransferase